MARQYPEDQRNKLIYFRVILKVLNGNFREIVQVFTINIVRCPVFFIDIYLQVIQSCWHAAAVVKRKVRIPSLSWPPYHYLIVSLFRILLLLSILISLMLLAFISLQIRLLILHRYFDLLPDLTSLLTQIADQRRIVFFAHLRIVSPAASREEIFELLPSCQLWKVEQGQTLVIRLV